MGNTDGALTGPDLVAGIAASELKPGDKLLGHANGEAVLLARVGDDFHAIGAIMSTPAPTLKSTLDLSRISWIIAPPAAPIPAMLWPA